MRRSVPLCLWLLCVSAVHAAADPIVFNTASLTTSGVFVCRQAPACSASGNTVTLRSGANTTTLTFTGVDTTVPISNEAVPVSLGMLGASSNSATFPTRGNPLLPIVGLNLTLTHTSPVLSSSSKLLLFGPGGRTQLAFLMGSTYFTLDPGPVPPGYGAMVYSFLIPPVPMNGFSEITAQAGVVPEPATMLLVGVGLAGAAMRRRKTACRASQGMSQ